MVKGIKLTVCKGNPKEEGKCPFYANGFCFKKVWDKCPWVGKEIFIELEGGR